MRFKILFAIAAIVLLTDCNKGLPVNFSCQINGSPFSGNGTTAFISTTTPPSFEVQLNGSNNSSIVFQWYDIDSIGAENTITAKAYVISPHQLPPFTLSASLLVNYDQSTYSTMSAGGYMVAGGTVTITRNTGPGGVISGTFSFDGINTDGNTSDSVVITQGTFTNISVVKS